MRKRDIVIGRSYLAKVSNQIVPVRIDRESRYGGWEGTNQKTGRAVHIKSAQRLRSEVRPDLAGYVAEQERQERTFG